MASHSECEALQQNWSWVFGNILLPFLAGMALAYFLDPVADKLIVSVALVLLVEHFAHPWLTIPAMIIVGREIVISALREWMAELGKRANVAVSQMGKIKTALQMISITVLLGAAEGSLLETLGIYALYGAALLTLWSMLIYLRAAWPELRR